MATPTPPDATHPERGRALLGPAETPAILAQVFAAAPDGIIVVDHAGSIVLSNTEAERLFGYEPGDLVGRQIEVLVPQDTRTIHADHRSGYTDDPHTRPMGNTLELRGLHTSGDLFPVEISLSPVHPTDDAGVTYTIAVVRDVTARRAGERRRRELMGEVQTQLERQRIAADLHDDMVQSLYAAGLGLYAAREDPEVDSTAAITRGLNELNAAIADLRAYIHYLRGNTDTLPGALLRSRVDELLHSYRGGTIWTIEFEIDEGLDELDDELQRHLFMLIKEMISNVERHADASTAKMRLHDRADGVEVTVSDDGGGFEPSATPAETFGLRGMSDRVAGLGGTIDIQSSEAGSTIHVRVPHPQD